MLSLMASSDQIRVIDADTISGNLLIHFSNGTSVLFQAHFLWQVRQSDGNVAISNEDEAADILSGRLSGS